MKFIAGADPELMLVSPKGELRSAIRRVPGTKKHPYRVPGGALQRDNVMAEINVDPAASCGLLQANLRSVLTALAQRVAPNRILAQASSDYPMKLLEHPEARHFGCDPDFDAWAVSVNFVPEGASDMPFRSAGGHLHIGATPGMKGWLDAPMNKLTMVRILDIFVGLGGAILDDDPTSIPRRNLYGKAGCHRPKSYGVEYRALGNFWIRSPRLVKLIYGLSKIAVNVALDERKRQKVLDMTVVEHVITAINNNDKEMAQSLLLGTYLEFLPPALARELDHCRASIAASKRSIYEHWEIAV